MIVKAGTLLGVIGLLSACANSTPTIGSNVQYGDSKAVERLTNEFGSTDLQTIAESMARSLSQTAAGYRSRPLVTIAEVKNKTSEYIDTRAITNTIRSQLLKSGSMRFATDIAAMQNQTDELTRQSTTGLYKKSTAVKVGKMEGAQYRIEGEISSIVKRTSDVKDVYYKFSLIMTDVEAGTIEWAEEKEIRKTSAR
ncbi:MAG: penicillin-binding protein activator LpoB [Rhodospirillaceae bacterium]